jgi:hypothetical protein
MTNLRKELFAGAAVCVAAVSGFSLTASAATFTEFDPQNSVATYPQAISGGAIAGYYQDCCFGIHGFLRAADGSITTFDPPDADSTYATSINRAGSIVGWYQIGSSVAHGFAPNNECTASGGGCLNVGSGTTTIDRPRTICPKNSAACSLA